MNCYQSAIRVLTLCFCAFAALGRAADETAPTIPLRDDATTATLKTAQLFRDRWKADGAKSGPPMVFVEPTSYVMGSAPEAPGYNLSQVQHQVRVSSFSIGVYEVTNADYCGFLNEKGNQLDTGIRWILVERPDTCLIVEQNGKFVPHPDAADRPVTTVSWRGAIAYCEWLTEKTGHRYRLPTEAEWECAARAGTSTNWTWGDAFDPAVLQWRESTSFAGQSAPVGSYPANPWGLYDTVGNVWEWVADCTEDDYYQRSPTQDPILYNGDCWTPGIRGGSFKDGEDFCRPGYRVNTWWWGEYPGVGFRVARDETPARWGRKGRGRKAATPPLGPPRPASAP